ncbi:unnamed protein product [Peniophora sp. CBMAI 1063]|nr:unnamed protein product [Peniophora sp. CBMAI 1063]
MDVKKPSSSRNNVLARARNIAKNVVQGHVHPRTRSCHKSTHSIIATLPNEVLSMIFHEATRSMGLPLFAPGYGQHGPGWFVLLWICARWREVLITDPSIWAACYSHYPKLQSLFIDRARLIPLVYRLNASEPRISPVSGMFRADEVSLSHFFSHTPLDKCGEIDVRDGRGNDITDYIFGLAEASTDEPLKILRDLHLETWHWCWTGLRANVLTQGHDAFAITADNLENVHLQNCWTIIISPEVRRFTLIFGTNYLSRPTIDVFYRAMTMLGTKKLTHLTLTNPVGGSYRSDVRAYQANPIVLPALTHVSLTGYAPHIANVLRIFSWTRGHVYANVRTVVGDGPGQSLADEQDILGIYYPAGHQDTVRAVTVQCDAHEGHLADRITLRFWSTDWSSDRRSSVDPESVISFGGAYLPCMWYETVLAALQVCSAINVNLLVLALPSGGFLGDNIPWEGLFTLTPNLQRLFPRRRILDSIGTVEDGHVLGHEFRARVHDFRPF